MGILVVWATLFGIILGQFFKWYVLVPACGLVIVLVLVFPAHREPSLLRLFLQIYVVTIFREPLFLMIRLCLVSSAAKRPRNVLSFLKPAAAANWRRVPDGKSRTALRIATVWSALAASRCSTLWSSIGTQTGSSIWRFCR